MIIVGELINASRKSVGTAIENNDVEAIKKLALDQADPLARADLTIRSAQLRKESRGLHYTRDYPETDPSLEHTDTILNPYD